MTRKIIILVSFIISTVAASAQNRIHFQIHSLPVDQPENTEIYLAGSFNGWNPQDKNFEFFKTEKGNYQLDSKVEQWVLSI